VEVVECLLAVDAHVSILPIRRRKGESGQIALVHVVRVFDLLLLARAKQKQAGAADRMALRAGQVGSGGDAAEQDEEVPEGAEEVLFAFGGHGDEPREGHAMRRPPLLIGSFAGCVGCANFRPDSGDRPEAGRQSEKIPQGLMRPIDSIAIVQGMNPGTMAE